MGGKYVRDFQFPTSFGFTGSARGMDTSRDHPLMGPDEYGDNSAVGELYAKGGKVKGGGPKVIIALGVAPHPPAPGHAEMPGKAKGGHFIQKLKKGALHKQLGVPESETIPAGKMRAAVEGKYGALAEKRAHTAETLKKLPRHHGPKK